VRCGSRSRRSDAVTEPFDALWADLAPVGRDPATGGYRRFAWTPADQSLREWFAAAASGRGLAVEVDRAGNQWAWWGDPAAGDAVVVGSHLDSVPDGGAYDGPLGVVSALAVVESLRSNGFRPGRPLAVVNMAEEEGARFGLACLGSRLLTGAVEPDVALGRRDSSGTTLAEAMRGAGHAPEQVAAEPKRVAGIGAFVELHVEQGLVPVELDGETVRGLAGIGRAVGVASEIWPHGRWRIELAGRADHAGTTALPDRDDPMLALAELVLAARTSAQQHDALATVGKVEVRPNAVNAIPSSVTAWLDSRGADEDRVRATVAALADSQGVEPVLESWTGRTRFDPELTRRVARVCDDAPMLPTGAGHDAGVLSAAGVPATMLFVRNPTGVSHAPGEHAEDADCHAGVDALTAVIRDLVGEGV
jgi:beta-ureidopropionase / N-carbamoyl-L-amino-acid hydrolase